MWRYHRGRWLWNASGKKLTSQSEKLGQKAVIWTFFSFKTLVLFSAGALAFHSACFLSSSLCRKSIAESRHCEVFTQNAYCCWKGLWGSLWRVAGAGGRGLWAFSALCRLCSLSADRLARSAFHLLSASSFHKLTVDVHTWPALGRSLARIDGWSTGKGMVLTACQSTL